MRITDQERYANLATLLERPAELARLGIRVEMARQLTGIHIAQSKLASLVELGAKLGDGQNIVDRAAYDKDLAVACENARIKTDEMRDLEQDKIHMETGSTDEDTRRIVAHYAHIGHLTVAREMAELSAPTSQQD